MQVCLPVKLMQECIVSRRLSKGMHVYGQDEFILGRGNVQINHFWLCCWLEQLGILYFLFKSGPYSVPPNVPSVQHVPV